MYHPDVMAQLAGERIADLSAHSLETRGMRAQRRERPRWELESSGRSATVESLGWLTALLARIARRPARAAI